MPPSILLLLLSLLLSLPTSLPLHFDVNIRRARPSDAIPVATLCTDSFYGQHRLRDGPVIFAQRLWILAGVVRSVSARLDRGEEGHEEVLLVAEEARSGRVCGCVDLGRRVFDREQKRVRHGLKEVPADPCGRFVWRSYVSSLAVDCRVRRRGVAQKLMCEAEAISCDLGEAEVLLEVAASNEQAMRFYQHQGYRIVGTDNTLGVGAQQVEVRYGLFWEISPEAKYVLGKRTDAPAGPGGLAASVADAVTTRRHRVRPHADVLFVC